MHARRCGAALAAFEAGELEQITRPTRPPREPVLTYGPEVIEALVKIWAVLDGPTGERLAPVMAQIVASLRRHGELNIDDHIAEQLAAMSAATIDRRLADVRRSATRPPTHPPWRPGSARHRCIGRASPGPTATHTPADNNTGAPCAHVADVGLSQQQHGRTVTCC